MGLKGDCMKREKKNKFQLIYIVIIVIVLLSIGLSLSINKEIKNHGGIVKWITEEILDIKDDIDEAIINHSKD
jgi:hypothetical protein